MTATLNNHKEIAGFLKCSMEHVGGPRPVTLSEHVKMGETVSLRCQLSVLRCHLAVLRYQLSVFRYHLAVLSYYLDF